jgi:hypothetical protein
MYDDAISYATNTWESDILKFCSELYNGHWLPSHDIDHHNRVWKNARILASNFDIEKEFSPSQFFEQLIIACYFHDTGLLFEKGPKHGKKSRSICEKFLQLHHDKLRFYTNDLLMAIEHHDDKEYHNRENSDPSILYQVLTLADDLDAFGAIGCYRYIEIYLMRNLLPAEIPLMIGENAEGRFRNFKSKLGSSRSLIVIIQEKFNILRKLVDDVAFLESPQSLVEWINSEILRFKIDPYTFFRSIDTNEIQNERIIFFLEKFKGEFP